MPRKEMNYTKTHFYKIVCNDLNIKDCYVGHTINFKNRKSAHKRTCNNENDKIHYNMPLYKFIRQNGDWDNFDMILINTETCENRLMALKREREYIEELNATLNKARPFRTDEELKEYKKEYVENNKDYIKQKAKEYNATNADRIREARKEYRNNHMEELALKSKEWRENNKEYIIQQRK